MAQSWRQGGSRPALAERAFMGASQRALSRPSCFSFTPWTRKRCLAAEVLTATLKGQALTLRSVAVAFPDGGSASGNGKDASRRVNDVPRRTPDLWGTAGRPVQAWERLAVGSAPHGVTTSNQGWHLGRLSRVERPHGRCWKASRLLTPHRGCTRRTVRSACA